MLKLWGETRLGHPPLVSLPLRGRGDSILPAD
jgi:hypothetical protein